MCQPAACSLARSLLLGGCRLGFLPPLGPGDLVLLEGTAMQKGLPYREAAGQARGRAECIGAGFGDELPPDRAWGAEEVTEFSPKTSPPTPWLIN